jgi:hypothetical protein
MSARLPAPRPPQCDLGHDGCVTNHQAHAEWLERRGKALDAAAEALAALVRADLPDREPDPDPIPFEYAEDILACPRPGMYPRGSHGRVIIRSLFLVLAEVLQLTLEYLGDDYGEKDKDEPVVPPPGTKHYASLAELFASFRREGPS